MNIRTRLTALILSLLLPAFAAGALAIWFVYAEQNQAQEKDIAEAARVLAQLVDNELENSEEFLHALAASPDLEKGRLDRFYLHAKPLSGDGDKPIIVSAPDGRQLLNTRLPFGAPPRTANPRLLELRRLADPYRTIVSDLFLPPLGRQYQFAIQVPVIVNGTVRYYMSRGVPASELQRFLNDQGFPTTWISAVVDRDGTVIARSVDPERFVGKHATGGLAEKIRSGLESGTNDGVTLDGKRVEAFFHRAPKSEWTIVLSVPKEELRRPALHAAFLLTSLMLLILFVALVLLQRHVRKTLAPIHKLRDDAYRLGRGEPVTRSASGMVELDEVSATLVQASERIREANADLENKVAEAVASTERAQRALLQSQKLEALGRLTGGVAHDFNNVLQTLSSSLQLMRLEADPAKMPARIAVCEKAIARATSVVAQLRAFGRMQEAYRETVRADQAVMSVMPMLKSALPSTILLESQIEPAAWSVTVDITQFELALLNLVINARDAIEGHGRIGIHVGNHVQRPAQEDLPAGEYVCIRISDTGSGMTQEVLSKVFDPFFTTKSVDKGNGLGLPQAYGFATQSQGTLVLDSTVGKGTTAIMYLPRARSDRTDTSSPAQDGAIGDRTLTGTILFVEDDALVRDSVSPVLERAGARVICAGNSREALDVLESGEQVNVLFSDIVMPGSMNGLMLAKHVRVNFPAIAIVLATGYFDESIDLPDARVLTKPYGADDAVQAIAEAVSAQPAGCATD